MSERKKMVTAEEIEEAALELSPKELLPLSGRLTEPAACSPDDEALLAELDRIRAGIRNGSARTYSLEEVLAELERDP